MSYSDITCDVLMNDSKFAKKYKLHERQTASYWLALLAFLESSIFLLPVDVIYVPMLLAKPQKAYRYAFIATVFSVLGALFGWCIGAFAYKTIALPILEFYDKAEYFEHLRTIANVKLLIVFLVTSGLVHLPPIKLINILAGLLHVNLFLFLFLNFLARTLRLYGLAWLMIRYGARFKEFFRPYTRLLLAKESRATLLASSVFFLSIVVVSISYYLQYGAGLAPCDLCLIERYLFMLAGLLSGALLVLTSVYASRVRSYGYIRLYEYIVTGSLVSVLISNVVASIYHNGVEHHWWAGPLSCTSPSQESLHSTKDLLQSLTQVHSPSCAIVAGRFLHVSFSAWAVLCSLVLAFIALQLFGCFRSNQGAANVLQINK